MGRCCGCAGNAEESIEFRRNKSTLAQLKYTQSVMMDDDRRRYVAAFESFLTVLLHAPPFVELIKSEKLTLNLLM